MDRIRVELPEKFDFSTELDVRIGDINHGNHLGNDALIGLLNEARVRFYAARGHTELDVAGAGTIMRDAAVVYSGEAFHGDRLRVDVAVRDMGKGSFNLVYRVTRCSDGAEIARAVTGIVFFDYARRRPVRTPEAFAAAFGA